MSGYRRPRRKKNRRPGDLTENGRIDEPAEAMPRVPEMEAQVFALGQLGMCQACGVEWGSCHVGVEATVIDRNRTRVASQSFWLCDGCRGRLLRNMRRAEGRAERVAFSMVYGVME